jgi:hypothetical protein
VVFALCLNDLEDVFSYEYGLTVNRGERTRTLGGRVSELLLEHSLFFSWIEYRRAELEARRMFARMKNPTRGPLYEGALSRQRAKLEAGFREAAALLGPTGARGVVAVFPAFSHRFVNYPHRELHQAVLAAAREAGLSAVDLLDCFLPYDLWETRVDSVHPSPFGHRIAAHAVADALCAGPLPCPETPADGRRCTDYRKDEFPVVRGY